MEEDKIVYGGIEAGGTGFGLAIAVGKPSNIVDKISIPTTSVEETKEKVLEWFKSKGEINSLGLASFGPIDLDETSPTYGYITTTPKPNWGNTDILGWFKDFKCPKGFDTDVNGAAISETFHNLHKRGSVSSCVYITVGTGVGVGVVVNGKPIHGLVHPEGGHTFARILNDDKFEGTCPFHKNCIEGLVSTGAISKRLGITADKLSQIPDDDPVWRTIGHYLGQLCANITCFISPEVIVLGGGVLNRSILYEIVREETIKILNSYIKTKYLTPEHINQYIVQSPFGSNAGLVGSLELARRALIDSKQ
ncbi:hypothetical protein DICPUDRAFT_96285 [Dictyostelium purpureum]|uniref:fructokinase n=1 Tax=Dictyostelium purpureum TaxID=5786 RepID=F0Z6Y5_DICPU|nr:uncharacterized protein DICPUDRAFT_96285 [Dictyostelium purpureum]EGC40286.1 hypothetical protein DICPUDRAFT_96285 [Dictyostelium purpureum]|eukprot:XP_003283222.1 hypothetical protein DICPUDRAFT_96285 [Dictyostelium purpureum]